MAADRGGPIGGGFLDAFDISLGIKVKSPNYSVLTIPVGGVHSRFLSLGRLVVTYATFDFASILRAESGSAQADHLKRTR